MSKEFFFFLHFYFLILQCSYAQRFPSVIGEYKNQGAQGMAIYGTTAYILYNTGYCRMYNLRKKEPLAAFKLASANNNNHSNCASFGMEKIEGKPLIYVSECKKPFRCFVEYVKDSSSVLIQIIQLKRKGVDSVAHDWVVDRKTKSLYTVARRSYKSNDTTYTCAHRINRYRLPSIEEGDKIYLTDRDMIDSYDVLFPNVLQGATIKGKYMYLPTGLNKGHEKRKDHQRALFVVNLKTHLIERKIDLTNITDKEPEDCDFYKGKLLLLCGQSNELYEIPTK